MAEGQTNFGFEEVEFREKTRRVESLFSGVAENYDLMNDVMSFGLHRPWKKHFVHSLPLKANATVLDVAGGTGDIAIFLQRLYPHLQLNILSYDLTLAMIKAGRDKAINNNILHKLSWCCGNGEALSVKDSCIDIYTVAFGMRNIANRQAALKEALRVLKPGGWFYCLEFSQVTNHAFAKVYDFYSLNCLPKFGEWIAKNSYAYNYLVESIRRFPKQEEWQEEISMASFINVSFTNLAGGIVAIHRAQKAN